MYLHLLLEKGKNDRCVIPRHVRNGIKSQIKEDTGEIQGVIVKTHKEETDAWQLGHAKLAETVDVARVKVANWKATWRRRQPT